MWVVWGEGLNILISGYLSEIYVYKGRKYLTSEPGLNSENISVLRFTFLLHCGKQEKTTLKLCVFFFLHESIG